jgi:hypothetical protein
VVGVLSYKQLANHVYRLIVFPSLAVYSNPYSNPPIGCSKAVTISCLKGGASIVGILLGEILSPSFLLYLLCLRVMRGL